MKSLLIAMSLVFGFWFFNPVAFQVYYDRVVNIIDGVDEDQSFDVEKVVAGNDGSTCQTELPKNGKQQLLTAQDLRLKAHARLYVNNEHAYPILLTLIDEAVYQPLGVFFVGANQQAAFKVPVGNYQLSAQTGLDWCSMQQGFLDARHADSTNLLMIKPNKVANLRVMPFGASMADMMLSVNYGLGKKQVGHTTVQGSGTLTLIRMHHGNYAIGGTINQLPVQFMLDTGASYVSVSERFAKQAGITECRASRSITANGIVKTCHAMVDELTVGQFTLKNVEISYNKGMSEDYFLLGMNVISLFKLEQYGDAMQLSKQ